MTRRHALYWLLFVGGFCLIVYVAVLIRPEAPIQKEEHARVASEHPVGEHTSLPKSSIPDRNDSGAHSARHDEHAHSGEVDSDGNPVPPEIPADKRKKMDAIYPQLTAADWEGVEGSIHPKVAAVLVEGMDALSAAKYLVALGHADVAREYASRAVAEDPGSFDALLLRTQLLPYGTDAQREAGYRQLLSMNPESVEALFGLGSVLKYSQPAEAILHLQKGIGIGHADAQAYKDLGRSYRQLGRYSEALAACQKSYQLNPDWKTELVIERIKADMEWARTHGKRDTEPEETLPESPLSEKATPSTPTEAPVGEAPFDESPITELPVEQDDTRKKKAQQAIEAEFEQLLADYERMIEGESHPSAAIKEQIADLERESKPKLSPDDDPDDERGRRKSESNQKRRERSTERSEDDEDEDDARADEDASEEDEER